MTYRKTYEHVIRLKRDNSDYLLPKNFFRILVRRFFPVMSLVYLISIFCIAVSSRHLVHYLLYDNMAYLRGILVVLWCIAPAVCMDISGYQSYIQPYCQSLVQDSGRVVTTHNLSELFHIS